MVIVFFIFTVVYLHYQNNSLSTTKHTIRSNRIAQGFDGYQIVQLSDVHNKSFGKNQSRLIKKVKELNPDLVVVTGDLVDRRKYNDTPILVLMQEMVEIAPVYYVTGNHEWGSGKFDNLEEKLIHLGVHVMRDSHVVISKGEEEIQILGIDDPSINADEHHAEYSIAKWAIEDSLKGMKNKDSFKILLSHRPELLSLYSQFDMDLIFSGHAHGGQFRIPMVGGLVAPNQGILPEYTSGKYSEGNTTMVVSRGLGNSIIPQRLWNRPEIVSVTLSSLVD
ncbi:metallophosphoesterase [Oceanobacillus saliphilus]|uniref:metallophosphoesterase n=1 Tax=Oceanobacillus saliphilus TaxID=2925834 RepID=UPI0027D28163|nr:metallophosphoesterase [Oceanobacillus saliphilus]